MTQEIRKLGANDLELADGGTGFEEITVSPLGKTVIKLDASHIKMRNSSQTLEDTINNGDVTTDRLVGLIDVGSIADGIISQAKLVTNIRAVDVVSTLPTLPHNDYPIDKAICYLTTDGKLYRNVNDVWTASVATVDLTGQITGTQIEDDSISTPKLQVNCVTADQILAGEVQAKMLTTDKVVTGCIQAGAITADEIASNVILAKHMVVGGWGFAINVDPNASDITAWTRYESEGSDPFASIESITDGQVGSTTIRSNMNTTANVVESRFYPVDASKTYRVKCWARSAGANGGLYLAVDLYDENNARIAGDGSLWYYPANNVHPTSSWTHYSGKFGLGTAKTFPSNARKMRLGFLMNYAGSVGYHELQDVRIEEAVPGDLVVDGAITGDKIAANTISVAKLTFSDLSGLNAAEGAKLSGIASGADVTLTSINGGLNITGTGLTLSSNAKIEAGYSAPGDDDYTPGAGFKVQAGKIEAYGADQTFGGTAVISDGNYMTVIGKFLTTNVGRWKRYPINNSTNFTADGQSHWYKWTGTYWYELANMGVAQAGGTDYCTLMIIDPQTSTGKHGIWARTFSNDGYAILGMQVASNPAGAGIYGSSEGNGYGGIFYSTNGIGIYASISSGGMGPILLSPSSVATAPTHGAYKGTLWVTSAGVLYINTNGISNGWQKVGAQ